MTGRCGKWGRPLAALSEATWIHPSSIAAAGCPSIFPHLAVPIFEANDFHCGRPSRVVFRQRPVMWTFQPEDLAASDSRRFRTAAESGRQRTPEFRTSSAPTNADRSPEVPVCPRGSRQGRFGVSPRTEAGESTGNPGVERGPPSGDREVLKVGMSNPLFIPMSGRTWAMGCNGPGGRGRSRRNVPSRANMLLQRDETERLVALAPGIRNK